MQQHTREELERIELITQGIAPNLFAPIKLVYTLFMAVLGWVTLTLEVMARFNFGERYLTPLKVILAWMLLGTYRFIFVAWINLSNFNISSTLNPFGSGNQSLPLSFATFYFRSYETLFLIVCVIHLGFIWWRNNRQETEWHSRSFGISWLSYALRVNDWRLYRFVEPGLFILVGLIVRQIDPMLGTWLVLSGGILLLKNQMTYAEERGRFLDLIDSRIESQYFTAAMQGASKQETRGFSVIPVPADGLFADAMEDIDTTVKETLE